MERLTEQEAAIVRLREEEGLTFAAIGERCGVAAPRASYLYKFARRKLRNERRRELYRAENQKMVTFELSLGEVEALLGILEAYLQPPGSEAAAGRPGILGTGVDHTTAQRIRRRLQLLDQAEREAPDE